MTETLITDLKPATDVDLAVAARKAATPKAPKPTEPAATSPAEPAKKVEPTPPTPPAPIADADNKGDVKPDETKVPIVEKAKAKAKKPVETFIKKEAPLTEVLPSDIPENLKLEIETYKSKASKAEELLKDPDIQILLEAKKSNKDIFAILDEVKGVDPKSISLTDLKKLDLQDQGLSEETESCRLSQPQALAE